MKYQCIRRKLLSCFLFSLLFLSSSCLYANMKGPLDTDVSGTTLGTKMGKSSTYAVAYLFAWGDASTAAAADNGNIKVIQHLDSEVQVILFGLYVRTTTVAYGD